MNPQEKLRLEHITPYLPYGLKYASNQNFDIQINYWKLEFVEHQIRSINEGKFENDYKPILRPLSDLTKNEFDDLYEDLSYQSKGFIIREDLVGNWAESMPYYDFKKLLKNHVDVFGLIEKGLAIDFNQLKLTDN